MEVFKIIKLVSARSKRNKKQKPIEKTQSVKSSMQENSKSDIIQKAMSRAESRAKERNEIKSKTINPARLFLDKLIYASEHAKIIIVSTLAFVVLGGGISAFLLIAHGAAAVHSIVTIEAGEPMPGAVIFAKNPEDNVEYVTDVSKFILNSVMDIDLQVRIDTIEYEVILRVVDTIAPTAKAQYQTSVKGATVTADMFVTDIIDATNVSVSYKEQPDFTKIGKQDFTVVLEDEGNNITELFTCIYIFDANAADGLTIEAGTKVADIPIRNYLIESSDLTGMYDKIEMRFEKGIDQTQANTVGEYDVDIILGNTMFTSYIKVVDTTPPTGSPLGMELWIGQTAAPLDFIHNAHDFSDFTARFLTEPDFTIEGEQIVTVIAEDIWGNASEFSSILLMKLNTTPPEIRNAQDFTVIRGSNVLYREGVTAWSVVDGEIDFEVDASAVRNNAVGSYKVIYTAVDSNGLTTTVTVTVRVVEFTRRTAEEQADSILSGIINSSMSQTEKARAIHRWIRSNIRYSGNAERDRYKAAYTGLINRHGDCFTYYAISALMLDRAGITNVQIRRTPGARPTNHWWNLIQINGLWYHFDACPNNYGFYGFMFTAEEAARLSANQASLNYYAYDPSLYPRIVGAAADTPQQQPQEQQEQQEQQDGQQEDNTEDNTNTGTETGEDDNEDDVTDPVEAP